MIVLSLIQYIQSCVLCSVVSQNIYICYLSIKSSVLGKAVPEAFRMVALGYIQDLGYNFSPYSVFALRATFVLSFNLPHSVQI